MLSEYSVSNHTLLIKFDANQQYSKEIEVSAYNANESISTNPFNDLPESKTLCLDRLPPWTDPDSVKNLMVRLSNGSVVKVSIRFDFEPYCKTIILIKKSQNLFSILYLYFSM